MSCCQKEKNLGAYEAANRTGWAGYCSRCGRTWPVGEERAQELLSRKRGEADE